MIAGGPARQAQPLLAQCLAGVAAHKNSHYHAHRLLKLLQLGNSQEQVAAALVQALGSRTDAIDFLTHLNVQITQGLQQMQACVVLEALEPKNPKA